VFAVTVQFLKQGKGFELCPDGWYALYQHPYWNTRPIDEPGWVLVADESIGNAHVAGVRDVTCSVVNRTAGELELFAGRDYRGTRLAFRDHTSLGDIFHALVDGENWDDLVRSVRTAATARVSGMVFLVVRDDEYLSSEVNHPIDLVVAEGTPRRRCFEVGADTRVEVAPVFEFQRGLGVRISGELYYEGASTRFDEVLSEPGGGMFTVRVKDVGTASFTLRYA
jgi:hypothetical protein